MRILASEVLMAVCHQVTTPIPQGPEPQGAAFAELLKQVRQEDPTLEAELRDLLRRILEALFARLRRHFGLADATAPVQVRTETTEVAARGLVQTGDGRSLGFSLDLRLSQTAASPAGGVFQDPLVIPFEGPSSQLTGQRWRFDMDGDGNEELLPGLASGSGLLVFDRNGDARIGGAGELFGAVSGEGFQELRALDEDGNGWIDEGDSAFHRLRVWRPGAPDTGQELQALGIGALWTGSQASPFDLGEGQLRATGVYLREDGRPGVIQQVDLKAI